MAPLSALESYPADPIRIFNSSGIETRAIDPEGDVYLTFEYVELLVSSKILSNASPVFKKMFGAHFFEGTQVSTQVPGRADMRGNCADDMETLCKILHHRYNEIACKERYKNPSYVGPLVDVMLLAHKYDCASAVSMWARQSGPSKDDWSHCAAIEHGLLILPAFVIDNLEAFQHHTKATAYGLTANDFKSLVDQYSYHAGAINILPDTLFSTLLQRAEEIKQRLQVELEDITSSLLDDSNDYPWAQDSDCDIGPERALIGCESGAVSHFFKQLQRNRLWPLSRVLVDQCLRSILIKLKECRFRKRQAFHRGCCVCSTDFHTLVRECIERAEEAFPGLCLDCVVHGDQDTRPETRCRSVLDRECEGLGLYDLKDKPAD